MDANERSPSINRLMDHAFTSSPPSMPIATSLVIVRTPRHTPYSHLALSFLVSLLSALYSTLAPKSGIVRMARVPRAFSTGARPSGPTLSMLRIVAECAIIQRRSADVGSILPPILCLRPSLRARVIPITRRIAQSTILLACDSLTKLFAYLMPGLLEANSRWIALIDASWSPLKTISRCPKTSRSSMMMFMTSGPGYFRAIACAKIIPITESTITSAGVSASSPPFPLMKQ